MFPNIKDAPIMAIDTETRDPELLDNGPGWGRGKGYIVGISVAIPGESWYFPMRHEGGGNMDPDQVLAWAKEAFSGTGDKVFTNANYDLGWLKWEGVEVKGAICDVQLAEPLIDEYARSYSLNNLAAKYLGESKVEDELYSWLHMKFGGRKGRPQAGNIWRAPAELVAPYAKGDVELPLRIWELQKKELERQDLWRVYEVEAKLCPMLVDMRLRGVRVDVAKAKQLDDDWTAQIEVYGQEFPVEDVNKASALEAYCKKKGIEYPTTGKGNPSFEGAWLKANLPIVYEIRRLLKARDTFVRGYILDKEVKGRLYGTFNQLRSDDYGTVSGRLSSSNPNLQNIPARDEEIGPLVRSLFLPDEGEIMSAQDWSQIEFRMLTHYGVGSGAELARSMYRDDPSTDFHTMVSEITGVARKPAKSLNFGLVYGMGKIKLASELGMDLNDAEKIFSQYHTKMPFVRETYNLAAKRAGSRGYVKTLLGRRARFNMWEPAKWGVKEDAIEDKHLAIEKWGAVRRAYTHKALNRILQGSAADINKMAMVKMVEEGVTGSIGVPLMTVHDELVWTAPGTKEGIEALEHAGRIMCGFDLKIPLAIDDERGENWGSVK
jgi:DNA polymerase I-like protein with 3'-5' exonuclease and polymerase domains